MTIERFAHPLFSSFSHSLLLIVPMPPTIPFVSGLCFGRSFAFLPAISGLIDCSFAVVPATTPLLALPSALSRPILPVVQKFLGP